jgi:hypothetical protein
MSRSSDISIEMCWPARQMVLPKLRVRCDIDEIDLSLRRVDYALVQDVVLKNIGEPLRHLDEWIRFQEMPIEKLQAYKERIMVHSGYDKKDADPSTYNVEVVAPMVNLILLVTHSRIMLGHKPCV